MEYDHKLISKSEVKDYYEDLETNFKLFKGLHERFCNLRETKDETELENHAVEDATYYDGVASKVYFIKDQKEEFDTSLRKFEAKQEALDALPDYEIALKIAKAEYEGCKKVVKKAVDKMDASSDIDKSALESQPRAIRKIFQVNMRRLRKQLGS